VDPEDTQAKLNLKKTEKKEIAVYTSEFDYSGTTFL
jgi:hypothetical protein